MEITFNEEPLPILKDLDEYIKTKVSFFSSFMNGIKDDIVMTNYLYSIIESINSPYFLFTTEPSTRSDVRKYQAIIINQMIEKTNENKILDYIKYIYPQIYKNKINNIFVAGLIFMFYRIMKEISIENIDILFNNSAFFNLYNQRKQTNDRIYLEIYLSTLLKNNYPGVLNNMIDLEYYYDNETYKLVDFLKNPEFHYIIPILEHIQDIIKNFVNNKNYSLNDYTFVMNKVFSYFLVLLSFICENKSFINSFVKLIKENKSKK